MNSKSFIVYFIACLFISVSCKKSIDKGAEYTIEGLSDLNVKVYDTIAMNLKIRQISGEIENVSLYLRGLPKGVTYSFSKPDGMPDFSTTLSVIVTDRVNFGDTTYLIDQNSIIKLIVDDKITNQEFDFNLSIKDTLSAILTVYDATQWIPYSGQENGKETDNAIITLFRNEQAADSKNYFRSVITDSSGKVRLFHLAPSIYYFIAEKDKLSNLIDKKSMNGKMLGLIAIGINKHGSLQYIDQDGDGKTTDNDRRNSDILILYNKTTTKDIWIGN